MERWRRRPKLSRWPVVNALLHFTSFVVVEVEEWMWSLELLPCLRDGSAWDMVIMTGMMSWRLVDDDLQVLPTVFRREETWDFEGSLYIACFGEIAWVLPPLSGVDNLQEKWPLSSGSRLLLGSRTPLLSGLAFCSRSSFFFFCSQRIESHKWERVYCLAMGHRWHTICPYSWRSWGEIICDWFCSSKRNFCGREQFLTRGGLNLMNGECNLSTFEWSSKQYDFSKPLICSRVPKESWRGS